MRARRGTVIITVVLRLARTINHRWRAGVTRAIGKSMTFCTLIQKPIIDYCRSLLIDACMCQLKKKTHLKCHINTRGEKCEYVFAAFANDI